MAKKKDKSVESPDKTEKQFISVPFPESGKADKEIKEQLFSVDLTFEELIKLSVTDVDKKPKK